MLAEYSPEIVQRVTDPRTGLPSRMQWLPTIKEVRDACEELDQRERRFAEAAHREREQIEARQREAQAARVKPTYEELKAKYGENWGLADERRDVEVRRKRAAELERANRQAFEDECRAAGMSPDSQISPSLAKILNGSAS